MRFDGSMRALRLVPLAAAIAALLAALLVACGEARAPGWTYQPAPSATPRASVPASPQPSPGATPTAVPSASGQPGASPTATGGGGTVLELTAQGIAWVERELTAPADAPFQIHLVNNDAATPHDVDIRDSSGATVDDNPPITGPSEATDDIPALPAGTYTYICSIHPVAAMTGTLTVE